MRTILLFILSILLSVCISTCITVNLIENKKITELNNNFSRKCCYKTGKCNYNCIKYIAQLYKDVS